MGTTVQRVVGSGPAARRADNREPESVVRRAAHGLSIPHERGHGRRDAADDPLARGCCRVPR